MQPIASAKSSENQTRRPFHTPFPELTITDPEVISELHAKQEGAERDEYALGALRLGVLALKQARGRSTRMPCDMKGNACSATYRWRCPSTGHTSIARWSGRSRTTSTPRVVGSASGAAASEEGRGTGNTAFPQDHGGGFGDVPTPGTLVGMESPLFKPFRPANPTSS